MGTYNHYRIYQYLSATTGSKRPCLSTRYSDRPTAHRPIVYPPHTHLIHIPQYKPCAYPAPGTSRPSISLHAIRLAYASHIIWSSPPFLKPVLVYLALLYYLDRTLHIGMNSRLVVSLLHFAMKTMDLWLIELISFAFGQLNTQNFSPSHSASNTILLTCMYSKYSVFFFD